MDDEHATGTERELTLGDRVGVTPKKVRPGEARPRPPCPRPLYAAPLLRHWESMESEIGVNFVKDLPSFFLPIRLL
ncbi:hypothetical protein J6590_008040 [Homalodisca vitripennis]|nr:hypothetical protein J6590_008040 [Homalodisca vitripennis]